MIKAGKIRLFSLDRRQIMAILLSCLATALSLKIPLLLKQVIDHGKMLSRTSSLGQIGFCLLISSLLEAGSQYLLSLAGDERIRDLRLLLQEKLLRLPWNYYKENSRGSLLSHVLNRQFSGQGLYRQRPALSLGQPFDGCRQPGDLAQPGCQNDFGYRFDFCLDRQQRLSFRKNQ
ncbi:ABC transporter transmembrane domain-containing protein [Lactobacillus delbrueckii]|nr:ABC transporter transmembrane domain-containing protein [Lactobacillus delbrueckii]